MGSGHSFVTIARPMAEVGVRRRESDRRVSGVERALNMFVSDFCFVGQCEMIVLGA